MRVAPLISCMLICVDLGGHAGDCVGDMRESVCPTGLPSQLRGDVNTYIHRKIIDSVPFFRQGGIEQCMFGICLLMSPCPHVW